uniref:Uncharacterized protein n=1 Tax=Lepeophtheirus salmonis TaxID=72036 RepID=A0A0K2TKZ6_LEPSM
MSNEFVIPELNFYSHNNEEEFVVPELDFGAQGKEFEIPELNFGSISNSRNNQKSQLVKTEEFVIPEDIDLSKINHAHFMKTPTFLPSKNSNDDRIPIQLNDIFISKNPNCVPKIDLSSVFINERSAEIEKKIRHKEDIGTRNPFTTVLLVKPIELSSDRRKTKPSAFGSVLRRKFFDLKKVKTLKAVVPNASDSILIFNFDSPSPDDDVLKAQRRFKEIV